MVYESMRNNLNVADELYIKRGSLALEVVHFFSLYSLSSIPMQVATLTEL